ncbi:protein phosphatase 1 regulatory subunit 14D isoform X1 [Myotis myotis]|uniref:protein phosphatase 1 regulatory subunit 14D isoform X1 n=1 Tax=Myotis myotis TaxID=51298 RepID=UPI00174914B2|nr:protein phosphatase 1 regulatory subunit 14D isoform X1 [Myotis myotis]
MLSSNPDSCTSPNPDRENSSKKVQWASGKRRTSSTDSESKSHPDPSKAPRSRRPSRLTVKYDRGHLQRWLDMEQWVDAKVQELFQNFVQQIPVTSTLNSDLCHVNVARPLCSAWILSLCSLVWKWPLESNSGINQPLLSWRLTWKPSWNYPQRSRKLIWRLFSETVPAPQSLLSPNCSVNSRNSGDSVGLRNKTCDTTFSSLSTVRPAPSL